MVTVVQPFFIVFLVLIPAYSRGDDAFTLDNVEEHLEDMLKRVKKVGGEKESDVSHEKLAHLRSEIESLAFRVRSSRIKFANSDRQREAERTSLANTLLPWIKAILIVFNIVCLALSSYTMRSQLGDHRETDPKEIPEKDINAEEAEREKDHDTQQVRRRSTAAVKDRITKAKEEKKSGNDMHKKDS
mmetsp:Transcript_14734/g.20664  ORF Transcript_14734/g.20664 Transcript_14734/m.20664 type:complete len:187 (+) Transcript_14734:56-616(+)